MSSITMHTTNPTRVATLQEKQDAHDGVLKAGRGYLAAWYKKTTLIIRDADIAALLGKHVEEFYKYLRNIYKKI